jgi:hypothetical protein
VKTIAKIFGFFVSIVFLFACQSTLKTSQNETNNLPPATPQVDAQPESSPAPKPPNLRTEILDDRNKTTTSPIGKFDFKNYAYPLPRGWQDRDGKDVVLEKGLRRMSEEKIGVSYVTTKFGDATGDKIDEAFVVLKIETAGSAIPQIVYIFTMKDSEPELIWYFRTGDRADGGLKNIYSENGEVAVELFGQDRFILGEVETSRITGDEEQLCCPTFFSRTHYKWNGKNFLMQGKRLTFSLENTTAPPVQNMGEKANEEIKKQKPAR